MYGPGHMLAGFNSKIGDLVLLVTAFQPTVITRSSSYSDKRWFCRRGLTSDRCWSCPALLIDAEFGSPLSGLFSHYDLNDLGRQEPECCLAPLGRHPSIYTYYSCFFFKKKTKAPKFHFYWYISLALRPEGQTHTTQRGSKGAASTRSEFACSLLRTN